MKSKRLLAFIIMLIVAFISGFYGAWWAPATSIVLVALLSNLSIKDGLLLGSLSLLLSFLVMALFMLGKDESGLIGKTGALLGGLSAPLMVIITAILGGVTGLFSGWLGSSLGQLIFSKNRN